MFTALHILYGLVQLGLAVYGTRLYLRRRSWYGLIAFVAMYGLAYDNLAIAAGSWLGEGALLKTLNLPRFVVHALITPLLVIYAFGVARRAGLGWARGRLAHTLFCLFATGLVALGTYTDIIRLQLEPERFQDTLRYVNAATHGPPIPAILTIVVLMVSGVLVWRKTQWPWLFVGSLLMFVAAGAGTRVIAIANLGEVALSGSIAATESKSLNSR